MAEALLKKIGGDYFEAESAGLEPGNLNPLAIASMAEINIDISKNKTKSVFDLFKQGKMYHYVITVCDATNAERCPVFLGIAKRLHWGFEDPAALKDGTQEQQITKTREIRKTIEAKINEFVQNPPK